MVLLVSAILGMIVGVGFLAPRLLVADSDNESQTSQRSIILLPPADHQTSESEVELVAEEPEDSGDPAGAEEPVPTPDADLSNRGGGSSLETYDLVDELSNDAIRAMVLWTDLPIEEDRVDRSWVWGPDAITGPIDEAFTGGNGQDERTVQYFQKGRVEVPVGHDGEWDVTSGLLVNELMSGFVQTGVNSFQEQSPADLPVFDPEAAGPTYRDLAPLLDQEPLREGNPISQRLAEDGELEIVPALGRRGITTVQPKSAGEHSIAQPFWHFMTSQGEIYDGEEYRIDDLFIDPYFATGFPITEPFWVDVQGDVLGQCFERRCLIYGPADGAEWRVQSNDVGIHYFTWRYGVEVG